MKFKIRPNENDDNFEKKSTEYENFLKGFNRENESDLWFYFSDDLFHDGEIESLKFSKDMRSLVMRISCPNLKKIFGDGKWEYLNPIWFTCFFNNVLDFHMETKKLNKHNDPIYSGDKNVTFMYSEINTLTEVLKNYKEMHGEKRNVGEPDFYSLIVQTNPAERNFSIIFESLFVQPDEPLAFQMLLKDRTIQFS